jgi:DsbC/DsbD-like thiol-disulfide interchange protein
MNYGYSDTVFLPVPIEIPADTPPGSSLPLRVTAHFYVCSDEMCVPEDLDLALDLPVREGAAPLDARFDAIEQALQAALPPQNADQLRIGEAAPLPDFHPGLTTARYKVSDLTPKEQEVLRAAAPDLTAASAR